MTDLITYVIGQLRGACWEEEAAAVEALVQERDEALAKLDKVVEAYAEEVEARNKELTLQLLATSGQAADALDKLTKAKEFLKTMADYNKYVIAPFLAELEGKE